jgi:hypothetical protein
MSPRLTGPAKIGAVVLALLAGHAPATAAASRLPIEGPFGKGAAQVWLLRPAGTIQSIVVFGHGWKVAPPSSAHPWVRQFGPWLEHLLAGGNAVVFPRYQLGGDEPGPARVRAFRLGLREGFTRLNASAPVVVVGYSYGATLGVTYAANAGRWGLSRPVAVDAIFPAGLVPGVALPGLDRGVAALVQVGDRDTVAGSAGARPIWAWLRGHAAKRYQVVRSHGAFVAVHAAPKEIGPEARGAFWLPLDGLVAAARRAH